MVLRRTTQAVGKKAMAGALWTEYQCKVIKPQKGKRIDNGKIRKVGKNKLTCGKKVVRY